MTDEAHPDALAFAEGLRIGLDPPPDTDLGRTGELTTRATSWWHTSWCRTCGHTFRRGDRVRVDPDNGAVQHLDPTLGCAGGPPPETSPDRLAGVAEFQGGLQDAWPVARGLQTVRTDDERGLLRPPFVGYSRRYCLVCGHSFRHNELVLLCPCRPQERRCRAAVHRDPAQGLVCWEAWKPAGSVEVCPVTLRRIDG